MLISPSYRQRKTLLKTNTTLFIASNLTLVMKILLIPKESFNKDSINTISKLTNIAENILFDWHIPPAKEIEFYNDLALFIQRVTPQVQKYGLTKNQAVEFIKTSLNCGTYGTFDISKNAIIEMNFNPYYKLFYPAIQFLKLIIHESLHLFLYSRIDKNIYDYKFRFLHGKYVGKEKIVQLDEGFAEFMTEKILEKFNFEPIRKLPIYSKLNKVPTFKNIVENLNIKEFNKKFDNLYNKNKEKGIKIIKEKFMNMDGNNCEKIKKLV